MSEHPARAGEYELLGAIAKGGMGAVYRAQDRAGRFVAIKLLNTGLGHSSTLRRNFLREVEATAALEHPAIVQLLDAGFVKFRGHEAPWIAMELVEGGTLRAPGISGEPETSLRKAIGWIGLKNALLTLLDALAHAHAHGVVHCDIKPSNVLLRMDTTIDPVLTDFGIARAQRSTEIVSAPKQRTSGTPPYMAPEQLMGDWRTVGPASDLYALGVMAWELTTGSRPFHAEHLLDLVQQVLHAPLPAFRPGFQVPRGFEAWLHKLLDKSAFHRFGFAADAAVALASLSAEDLESGDSLVVNFTTADTWATSLYTLGEAEVSITNTQLGPFGSEHDRGTVERTFGTHTWPRPPVSRTWNDHALELPDRVIIKQGLFGVRPVPIVGRSREQQLLWDALVQVSQQEQCQVVVVRGAPGIGKTRLCEWLCQRAHERGLAHVLTAVHTSTHGRGTGIVPALARHLGVDGLTGPEAVERLGEIFESLTPVEVGLDHTLYTGLFDLDVAEDKHGLGNLLARSDGDAESLTNPLERLLLFERTLRRFAISRPLILRIEDAQFGPESVDLIRHLLDSVEREDLPLLCVVTRDDRAATAAMRRQLDSIEANPRALVVDLGPLEEARWPALAGTILPLAPALQSALANASRGYPTLAIQWLSDHLERDCFSETQQGYDLDTVDFTWIGAPGPLWQHRIQTVCDGSEHSATHTRAVLMLAALLGETVDGEEWAEAGARYARHLGVPDIDLDHVRSMLVRRRLARLTHEGWQFVGGELANELVALANADAQSALFHSICADTLLDVHEGRVDAIAERAAHHALLGDRSTLAVDLFIRAVRWKLLHTELDEAIELLAWLDDMVPTDAVANRFRLRQYRARVLIDTGDFQGAAHATQQLATDIESCIDDTPLVRQILVETLQLLARAHYRGGHFAECITAAGRMRTEAELLDNRHAVVDALNLRGDAHYLLGQRAEAQQLYEQAYAVCGDEIRGGPYAVTLINLCFTHMDANHLDQAARFGRAALSEQARIGNRAAVAGVISDLGSLARRQGNSDAALACYQTASWMFSTLGLGFDVPSYNICQLLLEAGRLDKAQHELSALTERISDEAMKAAVWVTLASCRAQQGEFAELERCLDEASPRLEATGVVYPTIARHALEAGDAANKAGLRDPARRAWQIAETQLSRLDPEGDLLSQVRERLISV